MNGESTSFERGELFQVEVLSTDGQFWVDMSEHSTEQAAMRTIDGLRTGKPLPGTRSYARSTFRIRRFVVAEIIEVPTP